MRSLVISVLLYTCETWTLTADILKKLQATEMRCFRKLLGISYSDLITNDAVRDRIRQAIGPYDDILTTVKKRKLKWFGYVLRTAGLAKTILQGTELGGRRRGWQKKSWANNISEWTRPRKIWIKTKWTKGLLGPWRPYGHHDYEIGARSKTCLSQLNTAAEIPRFARTLWGMFRYDCSLHSRRQFVF